MLTMRVVVVNLHPLLRDIIATLPQNCAPVIVADFSKRPARGQLKLLAPDLVIVGLRRGENDRIAERYLAELNTARVLVVSRNAREAFLYRAPARRIVLDNVSLDALDKALADSELGN